jgi:hypothetical protein
LRGWRLTFEWQSTGNLEWSGSHPMNILLRSQVLKFVRNCCSFYLYVSLFRFGKPWRFFNRSVVMLMLTTLNERLMKQRCRNHCVVSLPISFRYRLVNKKPLRQLLDTWKLDSKKRWTIDKQQLNCHVQNLRKFNVCFEAESQTVSNASYKTSCVSNDPKDSFFSLPYLENHLPQSFLPLIIYPNSSSTL